MGKKYVERLPHSCGTKRGLQVVLEDDGRYTGYCFSCSTWVANPYEDMEDYTPPKPKIKSPEEVAKELNNISKFPTEASPKEKLDKWVLEYYGVKLGFDQETASEVRTHYYPYYDGAGELVAYQAKVLDPKKFFFIGDTSDIRPFGWHKAYANGGKKLFITEGQKDAMALTQVLKQFSSSDRMPSVISLPNGVKSVDTMAKLVKDFDRWAEVIICFDNDKAGEGAVKQFVMMYPQAKVAKLPLKDAHDMLMAGREQELFQAVMFRAKTQLSDKLIRSSDVWDKASERPEQGLSWPWPSMTSLTRGIRRGEGYYIGGGVKMGLQ